MEESVLVSGLFIRILREAIYLSLQFIDKSAIWSQGICFDVCVERLDNLPLEIGVEDALWGAGD